MEITVDRIVKKVTPEGLIIPKEFLKNVDEVEIRQENNFIVVIPIQPLDPILEFGAEPIICDVNDASIRHDDYLYHKD